MASLPHTAPEHEHSAAIDVAAEWLARTPSEQINKPIVPHLKQQFGLSTGEAVEAIRQAQALREGGADASR